MNKNLLVIVAILLFLLGSCSRERNNKYVLNPTNSEKNVKIETSNEPKTEISNTEKWNEIESNKQVNMNKTINIEGNEQDVMISNKDKVDSASHMSKVKKNVEVEKSDLVSKDIVKQSDRNKPLGSEMTIMIGEKKDIDTDMIDRILITENNVENVQKNKNEAKTANMVIQDNSMEVKNISESVEIPTGGKSHKEKESSIESEKNKEEKQIEEGGAQLLW